MKVIMIVAALVGLTIGEAPSTGYGFPSQNQGYPSFVGGPTGGSTGGGQTFRHVYVHAAPDEPEDQQARVIRVPGPGNKHVNIIFVKTPSQSASQQTEVILPEQDQQKTVVYVLHRKFNAATDLKIRRPAAAAPAKPQVYFIRYGADKGATNGGYQNGGSTSTSTSTSTGYGAPSY